MTIRTLEERVVEVQRDLKASQLRLEDATRVSWEVLLISA